MGQFRVPGSAVGHKWSNFQPFGFKFGLYSLLLGSSTWKTKKYQFGANLCPFLGTDLFGAHKLRGIITMELAPF